MQGRGRGASFSVIEQGPDGEPEVAFSSSEGTKLEDQRDLEELRRLLYVATTRARDRLYLAAEIDQRGLVRRGARSLASLLPVPLLNVFAQAAMNADRERVSWDSPQGSFAFRICRHETPIDLPRVPNIEDGADLDVAWLLPGQSAPASAAPGVPDSSRAQREGEARSESADLDRSSNRLVGTIVHRLFQVLPGGDEALDEIVDRVSGLLRVEERVDVGDLAAVAREAATLYVRLRSRAEVRAALSKGQVCYEVPFSLVVPGPAREPRVEPTGEPTVESAGSTVRGVIDCLVVPEAGSPIVLEFKTGRPKPEHAAQVEVYVEAVRAIFGVDQVEKKILYA
jgi:ATP-dependent exoDNAse (exonuclease V) beta subunit